MHSPWLDWRWHGACFWNVPAVVVAVFEDFSIGIICSVVHIVLKV